MVSAVAEDVCQHVRMFHCSQHLIIQGQMPNGGAVCGVSACRPEEAPEETVVCIGCVRAGRECGDRQTNMEASTLNKWSV